MISRDINSFNADSMLYRSSYSEIERFIEEDRCKEGKILIIYGLRRTGKTTLMEQTAIEYRDNIESRFYEVTNDDTLAEIKKEIIKDKNDGVKLIFIDEITKASDFISNSAVLADVFAKEGVNIVLTGTDSLGFVFAKNSELYDRTYQINTTHIPFAEHCEVLGTDDMDDYIKYGGLMRMDKNSDNRIVHDYESAVEYIRTSVADNIANSISKLSEETCLDELTKDELSIIVNKLVEKYSGSFDKKLLQNRLKTASISYVETKYSDILSADIIDRLVSEKENIVKDFLEEINSSGEIKTVITDEMVSLLQNYLIDMNVLSATRRIDFRHSELGWKEEKVKNEFYLIQPAIKYHHLEKAKDFIDNEVYYQDLSYSEKKYLKDKLSEKILGDMTEQIVVYDVMKSLPARYFVCKPIFYDNGNKTGEYDMLIYDNDADKYWGFEIKHSSECHIEQSKHLRNETLREVIDDKFGKRQNVIVLYRGSSGIDNGIVYLNIKDFLSSIWKTRDINKTIEQLTKSFARLMPNKICGESR